MIDTGPVPEHVFEQTPESLEHFTARHDLPAYLGEQLLHWVYRRGVVDPAAMTDLSARTRSLIAAHFDFEQGRILRCQVAGDDTRKLLVAWPAASGGDALPVIDAGRQTETVLIPAGQRRTACVSSQIGCPVGCTFCASGLGGLEGNLTRGRIVEQIHHLRQLQDAGRITNVVFMGMGEPLANFSAVTGAIRTMNAPWGYGISARKITVSTVGLPAAIRRLADFELPITLALSLHAPNDEIRRSLIPWAQYAAIDELVDACDEYFQRTGREITFEYLLLRRVNDRIEHARELAGVARRLRANVNLIRYNEVRGLPFDRPGDDDVHRFQRELRERGVNVHIRASRGRDIAAACGQLRHETATRA